MKTSNNLSGIAGKNIEQANNPAKKVWQKPDFYLIATDNVRGGANHGIHENNITSSRAFTTPLDTHIKYVIFTPAIHFARVTGHNYYS